MQRDFEIDKYRGLVMAYIVCVIHAVYWLGLWHEPWRSYLLVEMPVIFFISGAAHKMAREKRFGEFVLSKVKRVVIPYYIWGVLSLLMTVPVLYLCEPQLLDGIGGGRILRNVAKVFLFIETANFIPKDAHTWFIFPFLVIMLLGYFAGKRLTTVRSIIIACLILAVASLAADYVMRVLGYRGWMMKQVSNVVVYGIFFLTGFLYKRVKARIPMLIGGIACIAIALCMMNGTQYPRSLQSCKFPVSFPFMLYNLGTLAIMAFVFARIKLPDWKWLNTYNQRGFTIYLYQNWVFYAFHLLVFRYISAALPGWITAAVTVASLFVLHLWLSRYFELIENWAARHITRLLRT